MPGTSLTVLVGGESEGAFLTVTSSPWPLVTDGELMDLDAVIFSLTSSNDPGDLRWDNDPQESSFFPHQL